MKIRRDPYAIATLPAGSYYVGDPCYLIPDKHYEAWIALAEHAGDSHRDVRAADVAGHPVAACEGFGEGSGYVDTDGRDYPDDSGLVGVVPEAFAVTDEYSAPLVHLMRFDTDFDVYTENDSTIRIGHLTIKVQEPDED